VIQQYVGQVWFGNAIGSAGVASASFGFESRSAWNTASFGANTVKGPSLEIVPARSAAATACSRILKSSLKTTFLVIPMSVLSEIS